ncbi:MAG: glycosyl hydrolase family 28-related protein [Verrucomicrobiia bacterium]
MHPRRSSLRLVGPFCLLILLTFSVVRATDPELGQAPAIAHVVEGVEQGGTLTIFGERLTSDARPWLWQPAPKASRVSSSEDAMAELRGLAAAFPELPPLPGRPPEGAQRGEFLGDTGSPQVAMVRQLGGAAPAWDDSHILPTVLWIENAAGFSQPYLVNAPELWFASEHTALPGETVRVFGINLHGGQNNPLRSLIALKPRDGGEVRWGHQLRRFNQEHANVRQHEMGFRLPSDLAPGTYDVRVHHLAGGPHGWSNPLQIEVVGERGMSAQMGHGDQSSHATPSCSHLPKPPRIFRVKEAAADGITDDTEVIQSILNQAGSSDGGLVVLPAGVFAVTETLEVPAGVILQGAGREATTLTVSQLAAFAGGGSPKAGRALVHLRTRTGLQDLGVIAGPGVDVNVQVDDRPLAEDVFIRRVRIVNTHGFFWDASATRWQNPDFGLYVNCSSRGFRLLQSEIVAPMTFRMEGYGRRHRHAHIAGNRFETYPHHEQDNVFLLTLSESIFENNVMAYGHRAFTSQRGMWRNYIADNQVIDVRGVGNGSEVFMSEYGPTLYHGKVRATQSGSASLHLPEGLADGLREKIQSFPAEQELYAFVVAGTGFGQFQPVLDQEAGGLIMSHPWRVPLDETSEVLLLGASVHNLFLNNATEGGRGVYTFFYGSAVENAIVGNEASSGGVTSIWVSAVAHENESAVVAYNTLANNRLVQNGALNLAALDWSPEKGRTSLVIGNRVVRNQIWRPGEYGSPNQYYASWNWLRGANAGHGWVEPGRRQGIAVWNGSYNVIENNYIDDAETGTFLGEGRGNGASRSPVRGNTLRWNRIDRTPTRVTDHGQNTIVKPPDYQSEAR